MSIGARIADALDAMQQKKFESALLNVWPAIDATANREYPGLGSRARCQRFIDSNMNLITRYTFGAGGIFGSGVRVQLDRPDLRTYDGRTVELAEVIYKLVRCSLTHEPDIDPIIEFVDAPRLQVHGGKKLTLPKTLLCGFVAAVIASPVNKAEIMPGHHSITMHQQGGAAETIDLNSLWGRKDLFMQISENLRKRAKGK